MKTLKKVIALAIVATMVMGLCAINVSAANPDLPGFKVVFKNASGSAVDSAKAGTKLTAEITLPDATYQNAAVTLIPNTEAGVAFTDADMHKNESIPSYMAFNVIAQNGQAQAKAAVQFTIAGAPFFTIDVTVPATAEAGSPITLFTIKQGSSATCDLGDGNKLYSIPTGGHGVQVADGFVAHHAKAATIAPMAFGVDEDDAKAALMNTDITVYSEDEQKSEKFKPDSVEIEDFEQFAPGEYDVTFTIDKDSFTGSASSDKAITCTATFTVEQGKASDGTLTTNAADLTYTVATEGTVDGEQIASDFFGKGYTGTLTFENGYKEEVRVVAADVSGAPLDLTKASDLNTPTNVATIKLGIVLNLGTALVNDYEGSESVKAYVKKKSKASSTGSNIGIDTGSKITVVPGENGTVTASEESAIEGKEVTVIAIPDEGYVLDTITVKDSRGADIAVLDGVFIMPPRDVKVSATFKKSDEPAPGPTPGPGPVESGSFVDVPATHWAVAYIEALKEAGIIDGVKEADGYYFYPDNSVTRAEFAKMIVNLFDVPVNPNATVKFVDSLNDWYTPYVAAAAEAGYIKGISDTEFAPNATITRQDAFTILGRAYSGVDASETNTLSYEDAFSVADYAKPYLQILVHLGFVGGDDNNRINPTAYITRAESAKIISLAYAYNLNALESKVISDVTGVDEEEIEAVKAALTAGEILYAAIDDAIFAEITGFSKAEVIKALAENDKEVIATFDENLKAFIDSLSEKDIEALLSL